MLALGTAFTTALLSLNFNQFIQTRSTTQSRDYHVIQLCYGDMVQ